jgi:hypothetical protein
VGFVQTVDLNDRTGIAAGSPIPEELMRQLIDKLNLKELTIAYGMSEPTSPTSPHYLTLRAYNSRDQVCLIITVISTQVTHCHDILVAQFLFNPFLKIPLKSGWKQWAGFSHM